MCAYLTGFPQSFDGDTGNVDTTALHPVGTRALDSSGNEYIYFKGVNSCAAGSWITLDEDLQATLATANAKGRVGVSMAAVIANRYGWAQIYGKNEIAKALTGFVDNGIIYLTGTAGSVDDQDVAGDLVKGAIGRSAVSGGVITVELNYPFVDDAADD